MPKRFWSQRSGSAAKWQKPLFRRNVRARTTFRRAGGASMARGRFAGYYRKSGFYGKAGGDAELKFKDSSHTDVTVAAGATILADSIVEIGQDTTEQGRIGRKVTVRSINIRYKVTLGEQDAVASFPPADSLRFVVYLDKQCNGAVATATGITGILANTDMRSFNNLANKSRFTILMDRVFSPNNSVGASDGAGLVSVAGSQWNYSWYKKVNIPIEYNATAGAITEIRSNNIGMMLIGETSQIGFDARVRVRYSDEG